MLDFVIGALTGALAGCGVGGGTLLLLYLTAVLSLPYQQAKGINLLFFAVCAAIALVSHIKNRLVDIKCASVCAFCGIVAAVPAAIFSADIPHDLMKKIFGALFIVAGVREILAKKG